MTTESGLETKTHTHRPTPRSLRSLYATVNLGVGAANVGVSWVGVGFIAPYIGGGSGNGLGGDG